MNLGARSIRQKLQAIVGVATLTALVFALLGTIIANLYAFQGNQSEDLGAQADLLGRMTAPALSFDDPALASENLALLDARRNVESAAIYDGSGKLFARYVANGLTRALPSAPGTVGVRRDGAALVVVRPIVLDGKRLGWVYLRANSGLAKALGQTALIAGLFGLAAMGIAFLMIRRLEKLVTRPIAEIASTAREVVVKRDYSRRVEPGSDDEVGELVASFNEMLAEVERGTNEVMRLNASLEQRVGERTAALEESNRRLTVTQAAADEANRAKSSFLAAMSHEIRTPMNGVIGMVDVLHQSSLNSQQVEMVDLIRESALSLLTVIDDILDFSKIEAGRLELEQAPLVVADVVEKACGMMDHLALKKEVDFNVFVDPRLSTPRLGDALRLRQVLANLVSNAVKFSSGREGIVGRVRVNARLLDQGELSGQVEVRVSDNGIGMDDATKARLFTAFSQADSSTTRRFGGTGLGLVITRRIIDLMGGSLQLISDPGQGAEFIVRLPFHSIEEPPVASAPPSSEVEGLCCLVLGDPQDFGGTISAYLSDAGAKVLPFVDLDTARTRASELEAPLLWVVDCQALGLAPRALLPMLAGVGQSFPRVLALGRGARREPFQVEPGLTLLDGNVMTRKRLLRAAALAAGRLVDEGRLVPQGAALRPSGAPESEGNRLVLVAEDNETNQLVIERQLALLGFRAHVAGNGRAALELWQTGEYALVLTDLHMPEMDGYELTAAIRAQEGAGRRTPVLALTANTLKGEADRCREAGMDAYLSKPLQLSELQAALATWAPAVDHESPTSVSAPDPALATLDTRVLERLVGADTQILQGFLRQFRAGAREIAEEMRAAALVSEVAGVGAQAHKLKSSAWTVGAMRLGNLCARLESIAKSGNQELLAKTLPTFESEFLALEASLAEQLHESGDGAFGHG